MKSIIEKSRQIRCKHTYGTSYKEYKTNDINCIYNVNLCLASCDCGFYEDWGIPCCRIVTASQYDTNFSYQ